MLRHLVKNFREEYVEVAKEKGLGVGTLDAVSIAAMQEDIGVKDWQMVRALKHLRNSLGQNIAVPFVQTKRFSHGYVEPQVKKIEHQYENGDISMIHCSYQSVAEMTTKMVGEMLTERKVKPTDVLSVDFILGGDHGKEAFRLCFRLVVTLVCGKMHYRDYGGAGTVHGKDTPEVLEKSIMPWLTHDLEIIHRSKLVIAKCSGEDKLVCAFVDDLADVDFTEGTHIVHHVEIYNTGDLKWMAMLLGMADMSNEWCIFCFWRSGQWRFDTHQLGKERTIKKSKMAQKKEPTGLV